MSNNPIGYQTPKTTWAAGHIPAAADFNRIEGNAQATEEGARTLDPALTPSGNVGTLRQVLSWIANRLVAITGAANWWDPPAATLAALNANKANAVSPTLTGVVVANAQVNINQTNGRLVLPVGTNRFAT